MNTQDTLREQLLELHFGLLPDEDAEQWRQRIATEPDVARAWAEVLETANLMAQAARLEGVPRPPLPQRPADGDAVSTTTAPPPAPETSDRAAQPIPPVRIPWWAREALVTSSTPELPTKTLPPPPAAEPLPGPRPSCWVLALTAALAIVAIAFPLWRFTSKVGLSAQVAVRLESVGEPSVPGQSPNRFSFRTSHYRGAPVQADLSLVVRTPQAILFQTRVKTDTDGRFTFVVPGELGLPRDAKLCVTATAANSRLTPSSAELPLVPTRCLAYLTTDKPVYRPGETIYYRALALERSSLRAALDVPIHFGLFDPSGATVPASVREGVTQRGVGNGTYTLPESAVGGEYTLVARSLDGFFPEERRALQVRAYRVPRFKKDLEFRRKSYGPGESVEADFAVTRVEGGPLANAALAIRVTLDGRDVYNTGTRTSEMGTHVISFRLPEHIEVGDGQLNVIIDDGGTRETLVKAIPIQLGKVLVDFYPEGGDLVAGLENRVYFAARNPLGKPIHVAGQILDGNGRAVAQVATVRDGLGRFRFRPARGERYTLKVTQPLDVSNSPELPRALDRPVVLDTGAGVFRANEPLTFTLRVAGVSRPLQINASCRGLPIAEETLDATAGENSVTLSLPAQVGGVVRLTVCDATQNPPVPLAERLVYRRDPRKLHVGVVEQSAAARAPGEPVRLTLQVTDERGQAAPAALGVAVVDDGALSLADEKRPGLRTHFLLTSEIRDPADLEDADFYLADDQPAAAEALDLLLGTQGWRRFVERAVATGEVGAHPMKSGPARQAGPTGAADFREQLERLIELGGAVPPPARFDNLESIRAQLAVHADALRREVRDFLWLCLLIATPVLLLWLFSLLIRRLQLATPTMLVLLLALTLPTVGAVVGCGQAGPAKKAARPQSAPVATSPATEMADTSASLRKPSNPLPSDGPVPERPATMPVAQGTPAPSPDDSETAAPSAGDDGDDAVPRRGKNQAVSPPDATRVLTLDDLRRLLASRGLDAAAVADKLLQELRFPVREYAHHHVRRDSNTREDFTETLYWHPLLLTDADGRVTVRFDLSDAVTTFRVLADVHAADGRIGSGGGDVVARLPFQLEPKLPLEVTTGDRIALPVAVINNHSEMLPVALEVRADAPLRSAGETTRTLEVASDERRREHFLWDVANDAVAGTAAVHVQGTAGTFRDTVRRELRIAPAGYPVRESYSGVLDGNQRVQLRVPDSAVPGSLQVTLRAYPSPLADLVEGLESILREPHGCFEQASATNYPNTLTLRYLEQHQLANPELTRRAKELLDRGYRRLAGYECPTKGYEWFGQDPGHEALTAFGLLQFHDMKAVFAVNTEMVSRTLAWLLDRRDGQGSFRRNARHLHQWSVEPELVDAYILWALTEAGELRLDAELARLARTAETNEDPYFLALAAATLLNAHRTAEGERLLEELARQQAGDGQLTGRASITQSGGLSLTMETTALAALAWLKVPRFHEPANRAVTWIVRHRQGHGGFGSTQATVVCLKALVAHADKVSRAHKGGTLTVLHHGEMLGEASLPAGETTTVELTGLGRRLPPGDTDLELRAPGYGRLPYSFEVVYHSPSPPSDPDCAVRLTTRLQRTEIRAGETVAVDATLRNATAQGQPMTVAILGLPGGLEPVTEQLNELRDKGVFDYYELRLREVIFYWRTLAPSQEIAWQLTLTAAIPGRYTAPASRAYLYYTAERKHWSEPLRVTIEAD